MPKEYLGTMHDSELVLNREVREAELLLGAKEVGRVEVPYFELYFEALWEKVLEDSMF